MSVGVYTTLMTMLAAAPSLQGVAITFGEENINAQENQLPWINIVPTGGAFQNTGYSLAQNPDNNSAGWMSHETIEIYCWAFDTSLNVDVSNHADEVSDLVQNVLQGFQNQTAYGLFFFPLSGRWQKQDNEQNRYGRGYVLSLQTDITFKDVTPPEQVINKVTINPHIIAEV